MSDEIKEILDRLDFEEWAVDLYKVPITWSELYDIRDYITNLQQENDRLNNIINELEKDTIELMKSYKDVNAPRYDMCKHFIYKLKELKGNK